MGLSPRVRGNRRRDTARRTWRGSIPACAGERGTRTTSSYSITVYPRVCGGTPHSIPDGGIISGLSPRVRGNPSLRSGSPPQPGSIPACAGEPALSPSAFAFWTVYPRVCGGTSLRITSSSSRLGLSPRVRGNRVKRVLYRLPERSIPACAGEPRSGISSMWRGRVYPRVCGGTRSEFEIQRNMRGLSPRVRGNHTVHAALSPRSGSIPACAGEPDLDPIRPERKTVYPRVCGGT